MTSERYSYEEIQATAEHILRLTTHRPTVGIVCGSGLGGLADHVTNADVIHYSEIPHFPVSTVIGHEGKLILGNLQGKAVVLMKGRFHHYEGYSWWKVTMPVRVMKLLGVHTLLLTNAAGGCNADFNVGDMMIIRDHIDLPGLVGLNGLTGPHDPRWGPRFLTSMMDIYDKDLRQLARKVGEEQGYGPLLREGTYVLTGGPTFTTVAEIRFLKSMGADAVGMSTVPEAVVAHHAGLKTFALSLITDLAPMDCEVKATVSPEEIIRIAESRAPFLQNIVAAMVAQLP